MKLWTWFFDKNWGNLLQILAKNAQYSCRKMHLQETTSCSAHWCGRAITSLTGGAHAWNSLSFVVQSAVELTRQYWLGRFHCSLRLFFSRFFGKLGTACYCWTDWAYRNLFLFGFGHRFLVDRGQRTPSTSGGTWDTGRPPDFDWSEWAEWKVRLWACLWSSPSASQPKLCFSLACLLARTGCRCSWHRTACPQTALAPEYSAKDQTWN